MIQIGFLCFLLAGSCVGQFLQQIHPVNQPFNGFGGFNAGLGGQRAEGVVQAQPDVVISSLPQSRSAHSRSPQSAYGGSSNYLPIIQPQPNVPVAVGPYDGPFVPITTPAPVTVPTPSSSNVYQSNVGPQPVPEAYGGLSTLPLQQTSSYNSAVPSIPSKNYGQNQNQNTNAYSSPQIIPNQPYQPAPVPAPVVQPYLPPQTLQNPYSNPNVLIPAKFGDEFNPNIPMKSGIQPNRPIIQPNPSFVSNSTGQESLPKFLQGVDQSTVKKFKQILRQPNTSYVEKLKQVEELVSTLDKNRQELFRQYMNETTRIQMKMQSRRRNPSNQPSRKSVNDFEQISKILQNEALPENERWDQVLAIYKRLEPKTQNEATIFNP